MTSSLPFTGLRNIFYGEFTPLACVSGDVTPDSREKHVVADGKAGAKLLCESRRRWKKSKKMPKRTRLKRRTFCPRYFSGKSFFFSIKKRPRMETVMNLAGDLKTHTKGFCWFLKVLVFLCFTLLECLASRSKAGTGGLR